MAHTLSTHKFQVSSAVLISAFLFGYLLLVYAAANIQPVGRYVADTRELVAFVTACVILQGLWLLRWLELALLSHDEESRRFSALRLVDDLPSILCWLCAT